MLEPQPKCKEFRKRHNVVFNGCFEVHDAPDVAREAGVRNQALTDLLRGVKGTLAIPACPGQQSRSLERDSSVSRIVIIP